MVGAGIGAHPHLFDLCCDNRFNVCAICAAHPTSARTIADSFGVPGAYHDVAVMLTHERLDALVISVPPAATPGAMRLAAAHGLPALVDKPGGRRATDLTPFVAAPYQPQRFSIGYNRRYQDSTRALSTILQQRRLGAIRSVECRWCAPFTQRFTTTATYRHSAAFGDGVLLDTGSHIVDLLLYLGLLSPEPTIRGVTAARVAAGPDVGFSFTAADTSDRPVVYVDAGEGEEHWEVTVLGARGVACLDATGLTCEAAGVVPFPGPSSQRPIDDLVLLLDGRAPLGATVSEGVAVLAVLDRIRRHLRPPWLAPRYKVLARRTGAC